MATQIFSNTHEEIARAHDLIWKRYIPILLFIRIVTLVILTSGGGLWTLGIDYITLLFLYFYATKPAVAEVLLGWSIFTAIKGDSDLEDTLPNAIEKLNRAIIDIFIFIFIIPDTIGLLLPEIPFVAALLMVCIGIGCGLLIVKLGWQTTLFVSMVYASNIAILATTVVPYINLGTTENAQVIEKWLVDWKMIIGMLMFFIAVGVMGAIWKESKEKTVGFLVWIFNWKHFLISIGAIIVIYIMLSLVFPQATVWVDNFIATNQTCAEAMRKGEECLQVEATPQTPIKSPFTKLQDVVTDLGIKEKVGQSATPKKSADSNGGKMGGKVVALNKYPKKACDIPVRLENGSFEYSFTPTLETLAHPPILTTVDPGRYMVIAKGIRMQYYYNPDGTKSKEFHQDANGVFTDFNTGETFINEINSQEQILPSKPYASFSIGIGNENFFAGDKMFFTVEDIRVITAKLNVIPRLDPGTGSFTITVYQCRK